MATEDTRPKIGAVDDLEVLLGQRKTGKSTFMVARARQLRNKFGGAYVIGHSLGRRLPRKLPPDLGGHELPIVYYPTIKKLAEGLRKHPEKWHILAPPLALEVPADYYAKIERETADDLIDFSVKLSTSLRMAAYRKANPGKALFARDPSKLDFDGLPCTPIIVLIDEGVAVEGAAQSKTREESRAFKEWVFGLRHMHVALFWSIQDPTARGWHILGQATWLRVFHVQHEYALQAIRAAGGPRVDEDTLERIAGLYAYEHVDIRIGVEPRPDSLRSKDNAMTPNVSRGEASSSSPEGSKSDPQKPVDVKAGA